MCFTFFIDFYRSSENKLAAISKIDNKNTKKLEEIFSKTKKFFFKICDINKKLFAVD